jgi:hypothetical protein
MINSSKEYFFIGFLSLLVLMTATGIGGFSEFDSTDPKTTSLQAQPAHEINLPDERPIAFVRRFKPNVRIFNIDKFKKAEKAEKLYDGDTLATGESGYAAVQFMDNSLAKVKPSSLLLINGSVDNNTKSTSTRILLNAGEIMMNVQDQNRGDFEVATSSSVATVKGTEFGTSVEEQGDSFHYVLEGSIEVAAQQSNQVETITSGQFARVTGDGQDIETGDLEEEDVNKRRQEFDEFDEKTEPKKMRFEFRDDDGEVREIEIEYYENDEQ